MTLTPNVSPTPAAVTRSSSSSSANVVIKCAGVNKTFSDFWMRPRVKAVVDVNLEVRRGEVFGLLGPNGSGKSTTIKLILGLLHPTSGRIAVFGKRPEDVATKELIGYLPEESYLYRFLNARETLDYYGRLFHLPRHTRQKRIDMLLEMVGLDAAQHRPVGEYSKGMQRRIGLAQALINQPQLLILDEPTAGMDPIGTRQMKDLIIRLKERGITILLCSHLLADVEDVCERVTIMFGGRVVEEGTIDELLVQRDLTSIEAAKMDDDTIQQIEQLLAKRGKHIERVSHPRQTLEQKFLDLVERERTKGSLTSGAKSGGQIAGFLLDEDGRPAQGSVESEAAAVIDELTRTEPTKTQTPAEATKQSQSTAERPSEPAVDDSLLSELAGEKPRSETDVSSREVETNAPTEPEADLSVLAGLVAPSPSEVSPKKKSDKPLPPKTSSNDFATGNAKGNATGPAKSTAPVEEEQDASPSVNTPNVEPLQQAKAQASGVVEATDDDNLHIEQEAEPAQPPPKPQVSKESGESGLGLLSGLSADDEEFDLPPIDPPKAPPRESTSGEKPDAGFLKALEDADQEDEKL